MERDSLREARSLAAGGRGGRKWQVTHLAEHRSVVRERLEMQLGDADLGDPRVPGEGPGCHWMGSPWRALSRKRRDLRHKHR